MSLIDAQYKRMDWQEVEFLRSNCYWPTPYPEYWSEDGTVVNKTALVLDYWCAQKRFWDDFDRLEKVRLYSTF